MAIADIFQYYLNEGLFTHAYCARGSLTEPKPTFQHGHLPDGRNTFDLASITKALVTTPLLFYFSKKLQLSFDDDVHTWLSGTPHNLDTRLTKLSVRSLLAHDSGLPAWRNFWTCYLGVKTPEDLAEPPERHTHIQDVLNRAADAIEEKQGQVYSDVGFILLGLILELIGGRPLDQLFEEFLAEKLGIVSETIFFPPRKIDQRRFVTTGYCMCRKRHLFGEVHDENCASLGGVAGHAGVFGAGEAFAYYLHVLANSDVGSELLLANANARILPIGTPPNEGLLGWRQGADASSLPFGGGAAIGHMGFTGVAFWVWPETNEYVILLTNRVVSGRRRAGIATMRQKIFTELAAQ